jgi:transcriptional regulator with XRE-family HTH domain
MTKEASKNRSFGEVIRERRRQLELTQEEVALQIETSIPFIGHLEANKRRPSDATVTKLADALGLDRGELFFLANPEARALLQQEKPGANSAWEDFRKDERLQRAHGIRREELDMLSQVALMGEVRSVRDFVYILQTVRHSLSR